VVYDGVLYVTTHATGMSAERSGVVTELSPIGQFATWQAERAVGDHDRNTVHLPVELRGVPLPLEAGMTVWLVR
jgi:HlyD family secretion protein